jgi:hypothetical protein
MNLVEVGLEDMDQFIWLKDRDRWRVFDRAVIKSRVPWNAGHFLTSWRNVRFSRRIAFHGVLWPYLTLNLTKPTNMRSFIQSTYV